MRLPGVHSRPDLPRRDPGLVTFLMILGCGRIVVPCQFRGALRPCVRIEGIAAVQGAYGLSRNLDGTPSLVSKRPEKYRQVSGSRACAWMAVCKTVGLAYVGSNPTPATT